MSMTTAYINRVATGRPPHDVHAAFARWAMSLVESDEHSAMLLRRMIEKSGIEHRYSCLAPARNGEPSLDAHSFYVRGRFPDTAARMRMFEARALELAAQTIGKLALGRDRGRVTHLLITCCTGFTAPGLDIAVVEHCGLPPSTERTVIGFMGCSAAINALRLARHIVHSQPDARVLVVNVELCTLHLQETSDIAQLLCYVLFSDGCAASLVTSEPHGIALDHSRTYLLPGTRQLMSWNIGNSGFDMVLSGKVPAAIHDALHRCSNALRASAPAIDVWAVHPGGRTILDAVERAHNLAPAQLSVSRSVLRRYGNMSSAAVMFVLDELQRCTPRGSHGCAMAFGPGLVMETMLFRMAA
jgi:predicted naringenin-chalcone synthase